MPVTTGLAAVSDHLFTAVVLIYSVAMLVFAADTSFGRRRRARASAIPVQERLAAPVLVAAGERSSVAAAGPAGVPAGAATVAVPAPADGERDRAAGRPGPLGLIGLGITAAGWLVHVAEVITRGVAAGRVPWGDMYEFSSAVCLVAVGGFLILAFRQRAAYLGVFVMVPVVLYLGLAGTVLYAAAGPLQPVLQSYWLRIHVAAAILATGSFLVAGVATVLHLARMRYERVVSAGGVPRYLGVVRRLPGAATLEKVEHRVIAFAFPLWSFAIIAGAIWAESAWGRYWGWDPKETGSFVTWVFYAAYLHARATPSFRRVAPVIAVLALIALLSNYYVINLVVVGRHSYAGI